MSTITKISLVAVAAFMVWVIFGPGIGGFVIAVSVPAAYAIAATSSFLFALLLLRIPEASGVADAGGHAAPDEGPHRGGHLILEGKARLLRYHRGLGENADLPHLLDLAIAVVGT